MTGRPDLELDAACVRAAIRWRRYVAGLAWTAIKSQAGQDTDVGATYAIRLIELILEQG